MLNIIHTYIQTDRSTLCESLRCSYLLHVSVVLSTFVLCLAHCAAVSKTVQVAFETLLSYQPKPMERYSICKNLYISIRVYSSISSSFANHFFFAAELLCLALCISLTCGSRLLRLIENSCSILNLSLNERPFLKCRAHPHFIAVSIHFQQLLSIEICNRITHHYRTTISEIICFSFHLNIVSLEKCFFFLKKKTSKQNR